MADDKKNPDYLTEFIDEIKKSISTNLSMEKVREKLLEVDKAAVDLAKTFGQGRDNILSMKSAMSDAVSLVAELGGKFSDIAKIQMDIAQTIGRNIIVATDSYDDLFATAKVAGKEVGDIVGKFKDAGISVYQSSSQMKLVIDSARSLGVNMEEVTGKVLNNMDKLNLFNFRNGVEGLAKMAAEATNLRIDMSGVFRLAEDLMSPEKAIDLAASLQRLGVAQSELLDPLSLLDMSMNRPEDLQKNIAELGKSFVDLNEKGQFEILPGSQLRMREIAKSLGMMPAEFAKMSIAAAELDDKMKKIDFPDFVTDDEKQFIANMAEMNEKGEYIIRYQNEDRNVNEVLRELRDNPKELKTFLESNKPKDVQELAKEQLTVAEASRALLAKMENKLPYAIAGSKQGEDMLQFQKQMYSTVSDVLGNLDIKDVRENFEKNSESIMGSLQKALTDPSPDSFQSVLTVLGGAATNTTNMLAGGFSEGLKTAGENLSKFAQTDNQFAQTIVAVFKGLGVDMGNITATATSNTPANSSMTNQSINPMVSNMSIAPISTQPTIPTNVPSIPANSNVNLSITLSAPPNIDTAQLNKVFQDPAFQQQVIAGINTALTNQGQTPGKGN